MASMDVGGGGARRKAIDSQIPLVPFIDLLLCCVMFLLVTAVWNQLANLPASTASEGGSIDQAPPDALTLAVMIQRDGYVISTGAGDRVVLPRQNDALDAHALAENLTVLRRNFAPETAITLLPDDDIPVESVTTTMDTIRGSGFKRITFGATR